MQMVTTPFLAAKAARWWLSSFVMALKLCPWASTGSTLVVGAPVLEQQEQHVLFVRRQAEILAQRRGPHARTADGRATTLIAYSGYQAVDSFAELWTSVEVDLRQQFPNVLLLAFHPDRLDSGPGCSPDPNDAGHFSVRAPCPVLQLLSRVEVEEARQSWELRYGGRGGMGLLVRNKRRLRAMGATELRRRLHSAGDEACDHPGR